MACRRIACRAEVLFAAGGSAGGFAGGCCIQAVPVARSARAARSMASESGVVVAYFAVAVLGETAAVSELARQENMYSLLGAADAGAAAEKIGTVAGMAAVVVPIGLQDLCLQLFVVQERLALVLVQVLLEWVLPNRRMKGPGILEHKYLHRT